mmetsp:Transcript_1803/g.1251  ORF Transcript_1803/g.1251 Transcript_1803/m.1251 type:complete len:154 (+) Transcript_1803:183-644(+)
MNHKRSSFGLVVFESKLYAFGGISGVREGFYPIISDSIEMFNFNTNTWTDITLKSSLSLAAFSTFQLSGPEVLIFGGTDGSIMQCELRKLDLRSLTVEIIPGSEQEFNTGNSKILCKDGEVYAFGGFGSKGGSYSFNLSERKWKKQTGKFQLE